MSRSFTGCKRCKARRQKCDELRPECSRCKASGVQCRYTMQLQWGGRAFSRSRFGACVGPAMQKLEYSPGQFIYTTVKAESASPAEASNCLPSASTSPCSPVAVYPSSAQELDPFSFLSSRQKWLLQHFVRDASGATSCHDGMQQDICRMIVPMALQTPSLLYATMALSAIHIEALNSPHPGTVKAAADVANLMARSLEHFRLELQESPRRDSDLLLATARTLCLAEIHSGAILPNTWRAHVERAKALMSTASDSSYSPTTSLRKYLDRWYRSIVALAALNGNGPPIGEARPCTTYTTSDDLDYLDDYWGFTINLADIFREIGVVAWRRRQETRPRSSSTRFLDPLRGEDALANFDEEAARLEDLVLSLMARHNQDGGLLFYPGVKEKLSEQSIREFRLCNEAFQHTALIHILRRVRKAPATAPEVQYSVQRILACTSEIVPKSGLSPWVMLTTPLFTGGCEALDEDRLAFKQLLLSLYQTTRIPNVLQSLRFLEDYWAHGNQNEEKDWSHFLDRMNLDFIPY